MLYEHSYSRVRHRNIKMSGQLFLLFSICLHLTRSSDVATDKASHSEQYVGLENGDYRKCLNQRSGKTPDVFEVLPIYGFDNLRNVEMGKVIAANYSKCKLTEDRKFLLPDDVSLIPLKQSKLQEFAELITHWHNYTSSTSKSINAGGSIGIGGFGISGKYSNDYLHTKSRQVMDSAYTTRVQLRYVGYKAMLQPSAPLHPTFKRSLLKIAGHIQMNETDSARYESELIVRDYGTHVETTMDAGAAIVQEDFITRNFVLQHESSKHDILATASAHFFSFVHLDVSYKTSTSKSMSDSYKKSKTSSHVSTYGGGVMFINYTVNEWAKSLDNNLVAVDRSGDPLYYIINTETLPEVPPSIVQKVSESVKRAIADYYEYNTYRGCMDVNSRNFAFFANVDDGSCKPPYTNLTFGGVYQTCEMAPGSSAGDLCGDMRQPNPKTGKFSCPSLYSTILLHTEVFKKSYTTRPCHKCGWWSKCCHTEYHSSTASVSTYWCAAEGPVPQESGYLFGGVFSSNMDNLLTQGKSCPDTFYARKLGSDLKVCLSDDFELGGKESLPFGGFYSCDMGNPLAVEKSKPKANVAKSPLNTLKAYYSQKGESGWPKACPDGFSSHLAIIDQQCSIHYCVIAGALSDKGLPKIRRPPFSMKAPTIRPITPEYIYNINNDTWVTPSSASNIESNALYQTNEESTMSPGAASAISIFATLACVGIVTLLVVIARRKRKNKQTSYGEIGRESLVQSGYGATQTMEENC